MPVAIDTLDCVDDHILEFDEINLGRFGDALADGGQAVEAATSDFNLDGIAKLTKPWCSKYGILLIKLLVSF